MNNKISSNEIIKYIDQNPWSKAIDIAHHFAVTTMTIYRRLQVLVQQWIVTKKWTVPHVRYYPQPEQSSSTFRGFDPALSRLLDHERYQVSHIGQELIGTSWFTMRCKQRDQEPLAAAARRKGHIDYIDSIKTPFWILATHKLWDYPDNHLQDLWYGNIYALPEFGKTKYGTWMELAKTYPSVKLFKLLIDSVSDQIDRIVKEQGIDALCFVQPTAKRTVQIMDYLAKTLHVSLPRIGLSKVPWFFPPQKTLKKREERIANARASFEIIGRSSYQHYHHVLIIDDAVGSGATIVEIGHKILTLWLSDKVSGFSIVGTANGIFEQISRYEVLSNV